MVSSFLIVLMACITGDAENLLLNPSFEVLESDRPAHWNVFVQPGPGAEAVVDDKVACLGQHSAKIHNPDTYAKDPINNWSQNVVADVAGKTLIAGGIIKTESAGGAALWVQCWRKEPWGLLRVVNTSDAYPVSGTTDWTPVAVKVSVPAGTDFAVLRCVLTGSGTAWFDDVRVVDAGTQGSIDKEIQKLRADLSSQEPGADHARSADETKKDVVRDTESMKKALQSLRESNEALRKELDKVREELKALRAQIPVTPAQVPAPPPETRKPVAPQTPARAPAPAPETAKPAPAQAAAPTPGPPSRVPPLVPHEPEKKDAP